MCENGIFSLCDMGGVLGKAVPLPRKMLNYPSETNFWVHFESYRH